MKFLIFKLYRYAVAQRETVPTIFGFVFIMTVFEGFHALVIGIFLKTVFSPDIIPKMSGTFISPFTIAFVTIIPAVNYLLFVKTRWIYKIDEHYSAKGVSAWKGNLIVVAYMVALVIILFLQADWYQDKYGNH